MPEVLRAISLIQLAEALPIPVSGLGTREAVLLAVLNPIWPERVLALGFIWSVGLIVGRLAIGLMQLALSGGSVVPITGRPVVQIWSGSHIKPEE